MLERTHSEPPSSLNLGKTGVVAINKKTRERFNILKVPLDVQTSDECEWPSENSEIN